MLVKYEDRGSVDLGDAQSFVDSLVQSKYEDLFGSDENRMSGSETVSSPFNAADPVLRVYESDAVRKYVKMSNGYDQINSKLVYSPKYNKGVLISENMYDWTELTDESYIAYQSQFCGNDATISFIITIGNNYCTGELLTIGKVNINIDITPNITKISVLNIASLEIESGNTYFITIKWSESMNILEISAAKYFHLDLPIYKLQPYHYAFDIDNIKNVVSKYDIELKQDEHKDVIMFSFDGKITNIKVYNKYIDDISELLQMLPTNQHLIINDVCRKFVDLPGIQNR